MSFLGQLLFLLAVAAAHLLHRAAAEGGLLYSALGEAQLLPPAAGSNETVIAGARDTSTDILRSSDGLFAWKFVPYENDTRLLVVLSTLYTTTTIWIANREQPVSSDASLLITFPSREVILRDADGSVAWSTSAGGVTRVFVNGTGDLVMQDAHLRTVWASFDHLADVVLPGQRLPTNHSMTSRLSLSDVAPGRFTLTAEPGGAVLYASFDRQQHHVPYKVISYTGTAFNSSLRGALTSACNHTSIVFNTDASGVFLHQDGAITPECRKEAGGQLSDSSHGFSFLNRITGEGFRFMRLLPTGDVSTFFLSSNGLTPDNGLFANFFGSCQLPSFCGENSLCSSSVGASNCSCPEYFHAANASDSTQGCVLNTPLDCSKASEHEFLRIDSVGYYANAFMPPLDNVRSAEDCTRACLANCSCTSAFFDNATSACHTYVRVQTMQFGGSPSVTAFLRVASLPHGSNPVLKQLIIGLSFAAAALALCVFFAAVCIARKIMTPPSPDDESDLEEERFLESLPGLPPRYSYKELCTATKGFSKKLGTGGSGAVYEGTLPEPAASRSSRAMMKVAVKELTLSERPTIAACSKKLFRAEVASLGSASHVNLVQLRGFCAEGPHRLLVYEFMEHGSLDKWIFKQGRCTTASDANPGGEAEEKGGTAAAAEAGLSWEVRYRIARHTARGLAFLHGECRDKVVHLDVKPQNILLDREFRAKLADFGLCKLMDRERDPAANQTVTAMRGTPGYMAPEWFVNLPVTDRSDVFSYGMVLLELIGGRKNVSLAVDNEDEWYFPAWAVRQAEQGKLLDVVDKELLQEMRAAGGDGDGDGDAQVRARVEEEMKRALNVAFWCIQEGAASRPAMATVLLMLEGHLQVPDPPLELAYVLRGQSRPDHAPSTASAALSSGVAFSSVLLPR